MVRTAPWVVLSLAVLPAVAQACTPSPASMQQCDDGPAAQRIPIGSLVYSDTTLFQWQPDGSFQVRRTPLFRPSRREEQR
jgi:hypothetical protein